ncbi:MAG: hypothetical protein ACK4E8_09420 [Lacibacter sp.]
MKSNVIVTALLFSVLSTACRKNQDSDMGGNDRDIRKLSEFFAAHEVKNETFTINAATGGTVTTRKGTVITFPANAFKNASNQIVTGNVTVHVRDLFQPADMILSNRPTNADHGMLISYGEINVQAEQNGARLQLSDSVTRVRVPAAPNPTTGGQIREIPMWRGDTTLYTTLSGHNHENQPTTVNMAIPYSRGINWSQIPGRFATNNMNGTSSFVLDSLGAWRNVDVFYADPRPKTTVLGYFSNQWNSSTATGHMYHEPNMLYFKVRNQNILVKLTSKILNAPNDKRGFLSYQNVMPIGLEGTFLAVSFNNNKIYAEMKDVTIGSPDPGKNYVPVTFVLSEVTESQLLSMIQQMNNR